MTTVDVVLLVANAIVTTAVLVGGYFAKSYVEAKAANLATKEDTSSITRAVEQVKAEFDARGKTLQARLDVLGASQTEVERERRAAYLAFFTTCTELELYVTRNLGDLRVDDGAALAEHRDATRRLFTQLRTDYQRVILFSKPGSTVGKTASEVLTDSFVLDIEYRPKFRDLAVALFREMGTRGGTGHKEAVAATDVASRSYWSAVSAPMDKLRTSFGAYIRALNAELCGAEVSDAVVQAITAPASTAKE